MDTDTVEDLAGGLPEAFFDALAYVVPGCFLMIGMAFSFQSLGEQMGTFLSSTSSVLIDLLLVVVVVEAAYLVGQLLTTFSWFTVYRPLKWCQDRLRSRSGAKGGESRSNWYEDYRRIQIQHPAISPLVTKRYARWMAARNIALASLVLVVVNLLTREWCLVLCFVLLFAGFMVDVIVRKQWLDGYINTIMKVTDEQDA